MCAFVTYLREMQMLHGNLAMLLPLGKKIIMIASNITDLYFDIQSKAAII